MTAELSKGFRWIGEMSAVEMSACLENLKMDLKMPIKKL